MAALDLPATVADDVPPDTVAQVQVIGHYDSAVGTSRNRDRWR